MKIKKLLIILSLTLGTLILVVVLAFLALAGYSYHKSTRANEAAERFCSSLKIGMELQPIVAEIGKNRTWNDYKVFDNQHLFIFYGAPLYTRECVVIVEAGKISQFHLESND